MEMQNLLFLIAFLFAMQFCMFTANAQDDCSGLTLVDIYPTHPASNEVTVVLTKVGSAVGQGAVYTSIQLVTNAGDTLLVVNECPCYSLPQVAGDTFAYRLQLYHTLDQYDDLPLMAEGHIVTEFPTCNVPFSFQRDTMPNLPNRWRGNDCNDYKLIGMYASGYGNSRTFRAIIGFNNMDSLGSETGYTSFAYANATGTRISDWTGPDYYLPTFPGDALSLSITLDTVALHPPPGTLLMENPTCSLAFRQNTSSIGNPTSSSLRVYPNPTSEWLMVGSPERATHLSVRTLSGQNVMEGFSPLSIQSLPNGIYNVTIGKSATQVVVINR